MTAASTTTTTDNFNNFNPLPLQSRQLRPPKGPLYVPAALRPTKLPPKEKLPSQNPPPNFPSSPPLTPPRNTGSSSGSSSSSDGGGDDDDSLVNGHLFHPISRRSTIESNGSGVSKLAENEWMKHEHLGEVTGLPTRDHWKADSASRSCDSPTCRSSFGLFLRRHHCRLCGHVFCSSHSPHLVPLDQHARFHPDGILSRACDLCWSAYLRWEETRGSRLCKIQSQINRTGPSGSLARSGSGSFANVYRDDDDSDDSSQDDGFKSSLNGAYTQHTEMAASVPKDWNWSTF